MNYTKTNGTYYKVIFNNEVITFGELEVGQLLSTIQEVVFISKSEYDELVEAQDNNLTE